MLAANAELDLGACLASPLGCDLHQFTNALGVE